MTRTASASMTCTASEVHLDCDGPPDTWVTELQFELASA